MQRINREKSRMLYDVIDDHPQFYIGHAAAPDRSMMNVVFKTPDETTEKRFLSEAEHHGLTNLKGHRSVGGIRASIYNAMPAEAVRNLAEFMADFAQRNG
jgi:phosphoserine aminotransferase